MPDKILNAPVLLPGLAMYYSAFIELSTCRSTGFGIGPIPVPAIRQYGREEYSFDEEELDRFTTLVKELDVAYLKQRNSTTSKK